MGNFRGGGIGYGPRFRCVEFAACRTSPMLDKYDGDELCALAVLQMQSAAEGWEETLQLNPSILDCGLQSGSCLGLSNIAQIKKALAEDKKAPKKGKKKEDAAIEA